MGRLFATAAILVTCGFAEQPAQWAWGKVTKVEHQAATYDYSVFSDGCGYVGMSKQKLQVEVGDDVKFSISGKHLRIVDGKGRVQRTQYRLQWLAPPPPAPIPKQ